MKKEANVQTISKLEDKITSLETRLKSLEDFNVPTLILRDYFAAKAMAGDWAFGDETDYKQPQEMRYEANAKRYYAQADAMLAQRQVH